MADPIVAFGLVGGLISGFYMHRRDKNWVRTLGATVYTFLMLGTPLFFILMPVVAGVFVNRMLHKYLGGNWIAFLVSLIGVIIMGPLLVELGKIFVYLNASGSMSFGEAFGKALGLGLVYALFIIGGVISYVLSSLGVSIQRWYQLKHKT